MTSKGGKVEDDISKEHEQSEFNAAVASLQRIDEIKKWLLASASINKLESYYDNLKMFYKELKPMFTSEKEEQKKRWDDAKELKVSTNDPKEKKKMLAFFEEWELELRDIEQIKGLNFPKKRDARWALARGR